ncbi:hypothetical protein QL285_003523 [Trifolium repens]|nr:hypothetical protein QL285_003523 [Trifolium repens]
MIEHSLFAVNLQEHQYLIPILYALSSLDWISVFEILLQYIVTADLILDTICIIISFGQLVLLLLFHCSKITNPLLCLHSPHSWNTCNSIKCIVLTNSKSNY